ncbi:MAG: hypothetical protein KF773_11940 [Deltaproteobacteria bacterium]|nr:hypothetical protein [Deltaproteobacteria bacterium]
MRSVIIAAVVVAATAAPARAGDDVDIDGKWPFRGRTVGVYVGGHGSRSGGMSLGGIGPTVDLAVGDGAFQYFAELGLLAAQARIGDGEDARSIRGYEGRAGIGVRWLARSFVMERDGAIEMLLEAFTGLEQFWWKEGGRLTRPDLGGGWAWQVRMRRSKFMFRTSARVYFAPLDPDHAAPICRGSCMEAPATSRWSSGIMANMGVSW